MRHAPSAGTEISATAPWRSKNTNKFIGHTAIEVDRYSKKMDIATTIKGNHISIVNRYNRGSAN